MFTKRVFCQLKQGRHNISKLNSLHNPTKINTVGKNIMGLSLTHTNKFSYSNLNRSKINPRPQYFSLLKTPKRGFLNDKYKEILTKAAVDLKDQAQTISKKVVDNIPDSKTTKDTLKSASDATFKGSNKVIQKLSEMAKSQTDKNSGKKDDQTYFKKKESIHSIGGKVSFMGKFFAFFGRIFKRVSMWISKKIWSRLFSSGSLKLGFLRRFKNQIITRGLLLLGGLFTIIFFYKSVKSYIKNRRFRKKDKEIDLLKAEIEHMKEDLEETIKLYKDNINLKK
mmetsp:Transcript_16712/g.14627  ORF Transcript_16712/g.14627 Transcript_16712/m.14627 type:complete len:281 (-) Transcript_16712:44-886(-)